MYKKIFLPLIILTLSVLSFAQSADYLEQQAPLALQNKEFILYFQPICKFNKNKICGAETLTRWKKDGKIIPPGKFIPLFESNGFIKAFDAYVLDNALKYLQTWGKENLQIGFLTVNISALELEDLEFVNYLKNLLTKYKVPPNKIVIEITETAEVKNEKTAKEFLSALRKLGVKIALDDFGDGYATLEKLKIFPYDIIKLSKKLLNNFQNKENKKELKNTIKILKKFSTPLIAEGIENKKEAKFLKKHGVNLAQGYLYYKPMPAQEFKKLLSVDLPKYCNF